MDFYSLFLVGSNIWYERELGTAIDMSSGSVDGRPREQLEERLMKMWGSFFVMDLTFLSICTAKVPKALNRLQVTKSQVDITARTRAFALAFSLPQAYCLYAALAYVSSVFVYTLQTTVLTGTSGKPDLRAIYSLGFFSFGIALLKLGKNRPPVGRRVIY
ncbi:unnamed protein product [Cyclocybe aegerita]|uniref:Uncharacterized protein n=1 Tax=Cyclocybe aegerita TaxID=1973307 RepID=A0A8S0XZH8_CYCAE|nr:unnamed protein product [Cyclocybe aegerita]